MDVEQKDDWGAVWAFVGVLVGFKLVGLAILLYVMAQSGMLAEALDFLLIYHVPWFVAAVAAACWPARFWYRRLRARTRRDRMLWAEWHVDDEERSREHLGQP